MFTECIHMGCGGVITYGFAAIYCRQGCLTCIFSVCYFHFSPCGDVYTIQNIYGPGVLIKENKEKSFILSFVCGF